MEIVKMPSMFALCMHTMDQTLALCPFSKAISSKSIRGSNLAGQWYSVGGVMTLIELRFRWDGDMMYPPGPRGWFPSN